MKTLTIILTLVLVQSLLPAQTVGPVVVESGPAPVSAAPTTPVPAAPAAPEWTDDWFDADTYPSQKSAALNLGARWGRETARRLDPKVREIELHTKPNIDANVAHEARSGIASMVHGVQVRLVGAQCSASDTIGCASLTLHDHDDHSRLGIRRAGSFLIESKDYTVQAGFVEKPWAENFSDFANARPKENWLVARSKDPCLSESEARESAIAAAVEQLFPRVHERVATGNRPWAGRHDDRLRAVIRNQLAANSQLVPDRFLQQAQRGYGSVFRQALLVDASRPSLDQLVMLSRQEVVEHRQSMARTLLSAAALFFVVYLLYLFVNSMTRGYFVWSLRMVGVTVLVVGLVVLLLLG